MINSPDKQVIRMTTQAVRQYTSMEAIAIFTTSEIITIHTFTRHKYKQWQNNLQNQTWSP